MKTSVIFKICGITFLLLMGMACSSGGSSSVNSTPNLLLTRTSYNFAGIVVNNSTDHIFEIANNGNANLNVGHISAGSAPYSVPAASDACSNRILAPLAICSFEVRFAPTSQGIFGGTISIPSNDPDGTATIDLSGEGYGLNVWIKETSTDPGCVATVGVTVSDDAGNILDDIDVDPDTDFSFDVDENPLAPGNIIFDSYEKPSPVSVVLAIDTSNSEGGVLDPDIKNAAKSFINQLDDADEAAICSFNDSIDFDPMPDAMFYDLSTQRQDLIAYIDTLTSGPYTRFYDAVYESVDRAADGIATNKHLVVVLSDGVDSSSDRTLNQVLIHAEDKGIPVFTIYYRDPDYGDGDFGDPNTLKLVSDGSGGQDYDGMTGDLNTVYYKIVGSIRNMFIFELTVPGCSPGATSLDVSVDTGNLYGKDSTTITFP